MTMQSTGPGSDAVASLSRRRLLGATAVGAASLTLPFPMPAKAEETTAQSDVPLRRRELPNLVIDSTPAAALEDSSTRMRFYNAEWDGGHTVVRTIERKVNGAWDFVTLPSKMLDEQWLILSGDASATPYLTFDNDAYYYSGYAITWVTFDSVLQVSASEVKLTAATTPHTDLVCTWALTDGLLVANHRVTAKVDGQIIVGYQAFDRHDDGDAVDVLCGMRQHSRYIDSAAAIDASEMMAPMAAIQRAGSPDDVVECVYIPASRMEFEHLVASTPSDQPYGMSLRNELGEVQVVAYAPSYGDRAQLTTGQSREYGFGVLGAFGTLSEAFTQLASDEYDLRRYRENVYDTSMTDTVANLIDLLMLEPAAPSDGSFVPSPNGWWPRAKGFVDVENPGTVRQATTGIAAEAYLLTGNPDLYLKRARPLWEYQLSRGAVSSSPLVGLSNNKMCSTPNDASALVPMYLQGGSQNAGMREMALRALDNPRNMGVWRNPVNNPLQAYVLAPDKERKTVLAAFAEDYATNEILGGYDSVLSSGSQQYFYFKGWQDLQKAIELAGDLGAPALTAVRDEAHRLARTVELSPVPEGTVSCPTDPTYIPRGAGVTWDYPRDETYETAEVVPKWLVSTCGMATEAIVTHRPEGYYLMPSFAPSMLRLGEILNDPFFATVAENLIVGRFTNYPGYRYWQFRTIQMRPDFPLQGPASATGIYYTHIAPLIGLVIDQLVSEHHVRSGGAVDFPFLTESDYAYFTFRLYGHAPGSFYGETGVWPCLPFDSVSLDNHQVNWLAGTGNGKLYLSLTNASNDPQDVTVTVQSSDLLHVGAAPRQALLRLGNDHRRRPLRMGSTNQVTVTIPAKGIASVVIPEVEDRNPLHRTRRPHDGSDSSFSFATTALGDVFGQLIVHPADDGYAAYIQADTTAAATLSYSTDGGITWTSVTSPYFPNEWTISVADLATIFQYKVEANGTTTDPVTLRLSPGVAGGPVEDPLECEVVCQPLVTQGQTFPLSVSAHGSSAVAGATVALTLPAGWSAAPTSPTTADIGIDSPGTWTFDVSVSPSAPSEPAAISAEVSGAGSSASSRPVRVRVALAVTLVSVRLQERKPGPGTDTDVAVRIVNASRQTRSGTVALSATGVAGVVFTPGDGLSYDLGPYQSVVLHASASLPSSATEGSNLIVSAAAGESVVKDSVVLVDNLVTLTIDSLPPEFYFNGPWFRSGLAGVDGHKSIFSPETPTGDIGGEARFVPQLPTAGQYRVEAWYPTNATTTTNAKFTIRSSDGENVVWVDQTQQAKTWRSLGTYTFDQGSAGSVTLTVTNSDYHRISGIRFVPVD